MSAAKLLDKDNTEKSAEPNEHLKVFQDLVPIETCADPIQDFFKKIAAEPTKKHIILFSLDED